MEKKTRIALKKLFASGECGGLALPNMELYNIAFEMNKLTRHWANHGSNPGWVKIEEALAAPFGVVGMLSQKKTVTQTKERSLILQHSQWAWVKAHKLLGLSQYKQRYSSIWNNSSICIGKKAFFWDTWITKGIHVVSDLYKDCIFISFEDLKEQFNLTNKSYEGCEM